MFLAETAHVDKCTRLERKRTHALLGVKPLSVVSITCHQDVPRVGVYCRVF